MFVLQVNPIRPFIRGPIMLLLWQHTTPIISCSHFIAYSRTSVVQTGESTSIDARGRQLHADRNLTPRWWCRDRSWDKGSGKSNYNRLDPFESPEVETIVMGAHGANASFIAACLAVGERLVDFIRRWWRQWTWPSKPSTVRGGSCWLQRWRAPPRSCWWRIATTRNSNNIVMRHRDYTFEYHTENTCILYFYFILRALQISKCCFRVY